MLRLPDAWAWDSWYVRTGAEFHGFYLKASRALGDPELRHHHPLVGHAVSADLVTWTELPDALCAAEPGSFDDQGIWTGCVVRGDDDRWHMFYTGIAHATLARVQRIGHAVSDDLCTWQRVSAEPCVSADPRWYQTWQVDGDEPWRDPWVFRDGDHWRMLITAKQADGAPGRAGCIGTAVSNDLLTWTVEAPLLADTDMQHLEVLQVLQVHGRWVAAFCISGFDVHRRGLPQVTGTWTMPCDGPTGPFHIDHAEPIDVPGNYAGRIVETGDGGHALMAFVDIDDRGSFGGFLGDPIPVGITDRGTLQPLVQP